MKWFNNLCEWLEEHFVWPWDKGYQSIIHVLSILITFLGMIIVGLACADVTLGFTIIIGGGQIFWVIAELIRWIVAKRTGKGQQIFNVGNIFSGILGIVFGGLFACLIWWLISM